MYYYEQVKFKIPAEHDGRNIVTGEERDLILKLFNNGTSFRKIKSITGRSSSTVYRIVNPERWELLKLKAKERMQRIRSERSPEEKKRKNQQNRETMKRRIELCRKLAREKLPPKIRPLSPDRTYNKPKLRRST